LGLNGEQVVLAFDMEHGWNPISRFFGLVWFGLVWFGDGWVGPDYGAGLSNLKKVAEAEAAGLAQ
jgi:hypothetical protein